MREQKNKFDEHCIRMVFPVCVCVCVNEVCVFPSLEVSFAPEQIEDVVV